MKWSIQKTINIGLGSAAIILVGAQGLSVLGNLKSSHTYVAVAHNNEVKEKLNLLISRLTDLETAERGYLLTKEERYLEPYNSALPEITPQLEQLKKLISDNPDQTRSFNLLQPLIRQKLAIVAELIESARFNDNNLALLKTDLKQGKLSMGEIRLTIAKMLAQEEILFRQNVAETNSANQSLMFMSSLGVLIDLVVLGVVYFTIKNEIFRHYHQEKALNQRTVELLAIATKAVITKDDFLARMSHDIRTPLSAIIGLNYLALQTELTNRQRDYLQKIRKSAQYLLQLINDILDFSKIEVGMLEIEKTYFNLDESLANIANVSEFLAQEKGLNLAVHIDPDVPHALIGSPKRLEQVLMNLIGNAIKFTEAGEVTVFVRCQTGKQDQVVLMFDIQDTGIGLSEAQIGQLFEAFKQGDKSTERKYGGSGLGLAICKHLVKLMGGEIWIESEVGKGSCFKFTIVCDRAQIAGGAKMLSLMGLADLRVLVVDDNQETRLGLSEMLTSLGFEATTVASGEDAIAELARALLTGKAYHLVILDWILQDGMDGIQTAQFIQHDMRFADKLKLIMVTAYSRAYVKEERLAVGFAAMLEKPLNRSTLFDTIVRVCGHITDKTLHISASQIAPAKLEWLQGKQILLVEDNEINQQIAFELLTSQGLVVKIANNGIEAIAMINKQTFDCVLMDVQMPEMNGLEATRQIRRMAMEDCNEQLLNLPIIAMTANVLDGDREISLESGMNDHITKPISPEILFKTLLRWIPPKILEEDTITTNSSPVNTEITKPDFPAISGIDVQAGLRRIGGNHDSYRTILLKFRANHLNEAKSIRSALTQGQIEKALRLVHTIKGVAGNVGAIDLQQAATILELAIKTDEVLTKKLNHFIHCLDQVMKAIACLENPAETIPTVTDSLPTVDWEIVQTLATRTVKLLELDMIGAIDSLSLLKKHLQGTNADLISKIELAVDSFNIDEAQNLLQQIKQTPETLPSDAMCNY